MAPARFQIQPHDHVLREADREKDAFQKVCVYIAANPVRAELAATESGWPFTGCVIPGYPKLSPLTDGFWRKFWGIHRKLREPDAGDLLRPPLGG